MKYLSRTGFLLVKSQSSSSRRTSPESVQSTLETISIASITSSAEHLRVVAELAPLDDPALLIHHGSAAHTLMDVQSDIHQILSPSIMVWFDSYLKRKESLIRHLNIYLLLTNQRVERRALIASITIEIVAISILSTSKANSTGSTY